MSIAFREVVVIVFDLYDNCSLWVMFVNKQNSTHVVVEEDKDDRSFYH